MHEPWQNQIPFYVAGTLSADETAALERHLAECATCRRDVEEWRMIAGATWRQADAWSKPLPPLSAALRSSLRQRPASANGYKSGGLPPESWYGPTYRPPARGQQGRRGGNRSLVTLAAAVFITLILGALLLIMLGRRSADTNPAYLSDGGSVEIREGSDTVTPTPSALPIIVLSPSPTYGDMGILPSPSSTALPPTAVPPVVVSPTALPPSSLPPTALSTTNAPYITATPDVRRCVVTTRSNTAVPIYRTPYTDQRVVGTLSPGDYLYTWVSQGGWYQVGGNGHGLVGWVQNDLVVVSGGTCGDLPAPSPTHTPTLVLTMAATPTAMYLQPGTYNQFGLIVTHDTGPFAANTRVRVTQAYFNGSEWIYGVVNQDGTFGEVLERDVTYAPDFDPYRPTPTSGFGYDLGMGTYNVIITEDYGLFQAGMRVAITSAHYDGEGWIYTVVAEDGVTFADVPQSKLAYPPGYTPGPTQTGTAVPPTYTPTPVQDYTPVSTAVPVTVEAAYQVFQNGHMIWRADTGEIYVLTGQGTVFSYSAAIYTGLADNPVTDTPPDGLVKPINGFGQVWGNYSMVRDALGWGLAPETGYRATIQIVDGDITVTLPDGRVARINENHTWYFAGG